MIHPHCCWEKGSNQNNNNKGFLVGFGCFVKKTLTMWVRYKKDDAWQEKLQTYSIDEEPWARYLSSSYWSDLN